MQGTELEGQVQDIVLACNVTAAECSLRFALAGLPQQPVSCTASGCEFFAGERSRVGWGAPGQCSS